MLSFIPFIVTALIFIVMFIMAGGFFEASAGMILRKIPNLKDYTDRKTLSRALAIVLAANALGTLVRVEMIMEDTASRGYLVRNAYGEADDTAALEAEMNGETKKVDLTINSRKLSDAEIENALDEAEQRLPDLVLKGQQADHVVKDLYFPESISGLPVTISWMTDHPDYIDFDGLLTALIPENGSEVLLSAELECEDSIREIELSVTVYPKLLTEGEALNQAVAQAVASMNEETQERILLPETVEGSTVKWSIRRDNTGILLLFMGVITAVFFVYSRIRLRELTEEARIEEMKRDYPNLVSKLVLLTSAGMSMRKAFEKIRMDYLSGVEHGGKARPGYEEIVRMSREMDHGMSEAEAYAALGKRCRAAEYKTFATLLVQSTSKGGSELAEILRQEAFQAYEERKKRARVLGEEAGTKLLLPMVLMLGIVMAILMVPAFLTMF